jgi:hypothetical protein
MEEPARLRSRLGYHAVWLKHYTSIAMKRDITSWFSTLRGCVRGSRFADNIGIFGKETHVMARIAHPCDLTDAQWRLIVKRIPSAKPGGRHRSVEMREVVNGVLYRVRTGSSWRQLPHDFPPWGWSGPARRYALRGARAGAGSCPPGPGRIGPTLQGGHEAATNGPAPLGCVSRDLD